MGENLRASASSRWYSSPVAIVALCLERLVPDLHSDLGVSKQIVIPIGVGGCAPFGGKGNQALTVWYIGQWYDALLAAFGSRCREQEQCFVGEVSANLAAVCAKLFNDLTISVVSTLHGFSSYDTEHFASHCSIYMVQ